LHGKGVEAMDCESDMTGGDRQAMRFFIKHILPSFRFFKEAGSFDYGKKGAKWNERSRKE